MTLLLSLALAAILVAAGRGFLKKHSNICYIMSAAISLAVAWCSASGVAGGFPSWFQYTVWSILSRGGLATALFILVMYAGALPNTSPLIKVLMPVRAELSIVASILTFGHNLTYGGTYFRFLFTQPSALPLNQLVASVCSIIMLCVMLPLAVTSFPAVRKKMKTKNWKRLQRSAYAFYALIYIHVLLLMTPGARAGRAGYLSSVALYSVVFLGYAAMRVSKALRKRHVALRRAPIGVAVCACMLVIGLSLHTGGDAAAMQQASSGDGEAAAGEQETESGTEQPTTAVLDGEGTTGANAPTATTDAASSAEQPADAAQQPVPAAGAAQQPGAPAAQEQQTAQTAPAAQGTTKTAQAGSAAKPEGSTSAQPAAPEKEPEPAVTYQYKNGTFSGSADGFQGPITVNVAIENDVIKSIKIVSTTDDEPYFTSAKAVIDRILFAQNTGVDTVSGATFSSKGILNAVKAALSDAKN